MAVTLEAFVADIKADIEKFEAAYREKVRLKPDEYPTALPDSNSGLWFEFFMDYHNNGTV